MKTNKLMKTAALVLALLLLAVTFTACGAKPVTVTVTDSGTTTEVETETGKTVAQALEDAKITLGEKDECDPAATEKITEETAQIVIKRYAKVTIVKDEKETAVELVGGTVEEALKKAEITLAENESVDADLKAYLKDGMTINVVKSFKVTLTADGKTNEVTTAAKTVAEFLEEQKITVDEDDEISEKTDAAITEGMKIVVKRVEYKTETKTEVIDYETETAYSSSMSDGESEVTQEGVEGEKEVTYKVKYVDGEEVEREVVSEKVTKEPVNKIVTYGTASQSGGGSGSGSGGREVVSVIPVYDCDGSGHGYYEIHYSDGSVEYQEF